MHTWHTQIKSLFRRKAAEEEDTFHLETRQQLKWKRLHTKRKQSVREQHIVTAGVRFAECFTLLCRASSSPVV